MASLELKTLRKEFDGGSIVAVDDLELFIEDGEFVTVVGPSGCGKSTTLRMIAGLERPSSGRIHIGGNDITDVHARHRDVAMVFQNYALYPHKTIQQNMAFGLRMSTDMSAEEREQRVYEAAEMMGIEDLLDDTPEELSGGQKQRVALGRAIVREPDVFLFDEPLSNLDAKLRTTMRTEIQRLQEELGITSVYVTHDQEEAMTMGDRIVILNDGKLQQTGKPTDVYQNPANQFVAGFVGSPSMNFIDVGAEPLADGVRLTGSDGAFSYDLTSGRADAFGDIAGGSYVLGIRPEHVVVGEDGGQDAVPATVDVVEPVGSDNYLYLDLGSESRSFDTEDAPDFIARVPADIEPEVGDLIHISFEESSVHLFDTRTGEAVTATEEPAVTAP
ncbi:ABC transporter ATP-binding protein [Haloarcula nitratireducens]|uniref:ABC-type D-xylose/L-arabinose transporter n=1 Tax=Haloarcula nitratireducens TaxID=2487749 RepID=A0AAW4PBT0_9EURY|nr:ABC transporter ATP-binding protein [Halomicroarcula nitratireducens]MBX0295350.1 ABC transporter ATP-binding protein [Halomicroarcula nitratireducens]